MAHHHHHHHHAHKQQVSNKTSSNKVELYVRVCIDNGIYIYNIYKHYSLWLFAASTSIQWPIYLTNKQKNAAQLVSDQGIVKLYNRHHQHKKKSTQTHGTVSECSYYSDINPVYREDEEEEEESMFTVAIASDCCWVVYVDFESTSSTLVNIPPCISLYTYMAT